MPTALECPPKDRLLRLALGQLDDGEIESLSSHVLECDRCAATIGDLSARDTLADAMRQLPRAADARQPDAAVEKAIEAACRLHVSPPDASRDDTSAISQKSGATPVWAKRDGDTAHRQLVELPDFRKLLLPPQTADELGRLGPYRVLSLLDSGGMGMVFLAEDVQLQRRVALKVMKPGLATSAQGRERFLREARAAAGLRHDNVVTVYHVGEDRDTFWLAMELLEGEPLSRRLERDQRLPVTEAVRIGRQVAEALAAAHGRGLIHRDIKPANIWLEAREAGSRGSGVGSREGAGDANADSQLPTPDSRVKVLDFGLARFDSDDAQLTQSGVIVGTPAYMAPEQARGDAVDPRSDLFSLGCVLYRMLTGETPFKGKDTLATLNSLATHSPQRVASLLPASPKALDELVAKLLSKNPTSRPASAAELTKSLAAIEHDLVTSPLANKPVATSKRDSSPLSPSSPLARSRRHFGLAALAIAGIAAVAAAVLLTVRTPYGEVIVELGPGVKPDDVMINVERDGEVKVADAKHGWTISVREGRYNVQLAGGTDRLDLDQNTVTVSRRQQKHLTVSLKKTKPLYENDFSDWLPGFPRPDEDEEKQGIFSIQNGCYIIHSDQQNDNRWSDCAFLPGEVDIELVGRSLAGHWGFIFHDDHKPRSGIRIGLNTAGKVEIVRLSEPVPRHANIVGVVNTGLKAITSWKAEGQFNVLRARIEAGKVRLWINGEEACESFDLPDKFAVPKLAVSAYGTEESMHSEFDSIRIWRAGAGPALKPLYQHDFATEDPNWVAPDDGFFKSSIKDGCFRLESTGGRRTLYRSRNTELIPRLDTGVAEIVGRASNGWWGLAATNYEQPRRGIVLALDPSGQLFAWQSQYGSPASFTVIPLRCKRVPWHAGESMNVLRAAVGERTASVWINGLPACDDIPLNKPLGPMRFALFGYNHVPGFHCEFDALRIWQAGDAPPPTSAAKPITASNDDYGQYLTSRNPVFETDFSVPDWHWEVTEKAADFQSVVRNGRLLLEHRRIPWKSWAPAEFPPWIDKPDLEVVGRASAGLWGFAAVNNEDPRRGVQVRIDQQGRLTAWSFLKQSGDEGPSLVPIEVVPKGTVPAPANSFGTLRASVGDRSIRVWLNGELACDDIPLDRPLGPVKVSLAAAGVDEPFKCDFDSLRIWSAGEGPPLLPLPALPDVKPSPAQADPPQ